MANEENQDKIAEELAKGFLDEPTDASVLNPTGIPAGGDPPQQDPPEGGANPPVPQGQAYIPAYSTAWKQLEEDGIELPENFKKGQFKDAKEEFNALRQVISDNTEPEGGNVEDDDIFLNAYKSIAVEKRGEFLDSFYQTNQYLSLPSKEGLSIYYGNLQTPDGKPKYTEDVVNKYIESKSEIELDNEWTGVRNNTIKMRDDYFQQFKGGGGNVNPQDVESRNKLIDQRVQNVVKEVMGMESYQDIPLTKEAREDFAVKFQAISRINPKTGRPYFMTMLNDDKVLRDMLLSYEIVHGELGVHLSNFKEDFKDGLLTKLSLTKRPKSGASAFVSATNPADFV